MSAPALNVIVLPGAPGRAASRGPVPSDPEGSFHAVLGGVTDGPAPPATDVKLSKDAGALQDAANDLLEDGGESPTTPEGLPVALDLICLATMPPPSAPIAERAVDDAGIMPGPAATAAPMATAAVDVLADPQADPDLPAPSAGEKTASAMLPAAPPALPPTAPSPVAPTAGTPQALPVAAPSPPASAQPVMADMVVAQTATVEPAAKAEAAPAPGPKDRARKSSAAETARTETAAPARPGSPTTEAVVVATDDAHPSESREPGRPAEAAAAPDPALDGPDSVQTPAEARAAQAAAPPPPQAALLRGAPETVATLAAKIIRKLDERSTRFDLELDPAGLGRVDVRVEIGAHGRMTAAMSFDNPQAAAELRARAGELHKALEQAGFDVSGGMSFDVAGEGRSGQGAWEEQADSGAAFRGRAFQAALDTAAGADPTQGLRLRRTLVSGVDIRI